MSLASFAAFLSCSLGEELDGDEKERRAVERHGNGRATVPIINEECDDDDDEDNDNDNDDDVDDGSNANAEMALRGQRNMLFKISVWRGD